MHVWPPQWADIGNLTWKKLSPSSLFSAVSVFWWFSFSIRHQVKENEACPGWQTAFGWHSRNMCSLFQSRDPHQITTAYACMVCATWAKLAESAAPSLPRSRAQDQREAGLSIYSWALLFLWYFTFPARQDEKQMPPKYDERGYSWKCL